MFSYKTSQSICRNAFFTALVLGYGSPVTPHDALCEQDAALFTSSLINSDQKTDISRHHLPAFPLLQPLLPESPDLHLRSSLAAFGIMTSLFANSKLLWQPVDPDHARVEAFRRFVNRKHGFSFSEYVGSYQGLC